MSNQKKKLEITGYLLYPIKIGEYAWIQEQNGVRRTTPVVRMERFTSSEVRFETRNTLYIGSYRIDHLKVPIMTERSPEFGDLSQKIFYAGH